MSHIRSGHCEGASKEEVDQFKKEFVYDSPKSLVHKSAITKRFKESFEIEEYKPRKSPKRSSRNSVKSKTEALDNEVIDENPFEEMGDEEETLLYEEIASGHNNEEGDDKVEILYLSEDVDITQGSKQQPSLSTKQMSREEKFIQAVYPQFKGRTKLNLIDEILDLKRQNDLLASKAKTYEDTINRLLNWNCLEFNKI